MRRISQCLAEQAFARRGIAQSREREVDRGAGGIDGSVEVAPTPLDTNAGLIDTQAESGGSANLAGQILTGRECGEAEGFSKGCGNPLLRIFTALHFHRPEAVILGSSVSRRDLAMIWGKRDPRIACEQRSEADPMWSCPNLLWPFANMTQRSE